MAHARVRSSSARLVPGTPALPSRMLRIEFKGQPYDWFNLDEMGDVVRQEDFGNTLRENIVHYFSVPYDCQAIYDEEGILASAPDFSRALQSVRPYLRVFDIREMQPEFREQQIQKLAAICSEVMRCQKNLQTAINPVNLGINSRPSVTSVPVETGSYAGTVGQRPVSPWPIREAHSTMTDRLAVPGALPTRCGAMPPAAAVPQGMVIPPLRAEPAAATRQPTGLRSVPVACHPVGQEPTTAIQMPQDGLVSGSGWATPSRPATPSKPSYDMTRRPSWSGAPGAQETLPSADGCIDVMLSKGIAHGEKMDRFGFANVPTADGRALLITWVDTTGLLGMWNRSYPDKMVREGDTILAVNGVGGDVEAMRAQLQFDTIRMVIQRH